MAISVRHFLIGLLVLAIAISNAGATSFMRAEGCASVLDQHASHGHAFNPAPGHAMQDGTKHDASPEHCALCILAAAAAPAAPGVAIALIASGVLSPVAENLAPGQIVVLDPGIPKQSAC